MKTRDQNREKLAVLVADMYRKATRRRNEREVYITERQYQYLVSMCRKVYGGGKDESWLSMPGYTAVTGPKRCYFTLFPS